MKKSKMVTLVLITTALAYCNKPKHRNSNYYLRSDSTAGYTRAHGHSTGLWYYAFRPYGRYYGGNYNHAGYYSNGINERSNIGGNPLKGGIIRGGFGRSSGFSVSS